MNARNEYTPEAISGIAAALAAAPAPQRPMSKAEALAKLAPEMKAARDRGHGLQDIAKLLEQQGIKTYPRAIASAIKEHESAGGAKRGRKPRKDAGGEDAQLRRELEAAGQQRLDA